jgi:hypothetical protein
VNATGTQNADGSLTVTVTEDSTFLSSTCAQQSILTYTDPPKIFLYLTFSVDGVNPQIDVQPLLNMPLEITTVPAISLAVAPLSQTGTVATYLATVSSTTYGGSVTLGLQGGSCAKLMGPQPTVSLPTQPVAKIWVMTAGCAPGTNTTLTFTAAGTGTQADPQTLMLQTVPTAAVIRSPAPGSTIPGGLTTFSWIPVNGGTYCLSTGTSPQATCSGTAQPGVQVSLPTSGTVYATLGTQVNGGAWQYEQSAYTVNPSPSTAQLVVSGTTVVAVPNNGARVRGTYYFSSGDPRTISTVTTSVAGLTATVVGASPNTATIEFQANSSVATGVATSLTAQAPGGPAVWEGPEPVAGMVIAVEQTPLPLGQTFTVDVLDDQGSSEGFWEICDPTGNCTDSTYSGPPASFSYQATVPGTYSATLYGLTDAYPICTDGDCLVVSNEADFVASGSAAPGTTVSGQVTSTVDYSGVPGVTITDSSGPTATTDANGNYTININGASDTLTPSKTGYTFNPASSQANGTPGVSVNFTATPSGTVPNITAISPQSTTPDQANDGALFSVSGTSLVSSNASGVVFVDGSGNPDPTVTFTVTQQGDTLIQGTIYIDPSAAGGAHSFYVASPNGNSNTLTLTVSADPVITSVNPSTFTAGQAPTPVTIAGQHFASSCSTSTPVTVCRSGASPCTQTQDVAPALPPSTCADTQIVTTFTIGASASGSYDLLVGTDPTAASGTGNAMMAADQQGPGPRAPLQVGSSPQVSLKVTYNGQPMAAGSTALIAKGQDQYETPVMPQITAKIVDGNDKAVAGQASWIMTVTFPQYMSDAQWALGASTGTPVPQTVLIGGAAGPPPINVDASQPFQAPWGSTFIGGDATINWYYNGFKQQPFSFVIRGQNPDQPVLASRLASSQYWFAPYISMHETRQAQFCLQPGGRTAISAYCNDQNPLPDPPPSGSGGAVTYISPVGMPIYGHPRGYGAMQLDYPVPTIQQIWNWQANVDQGKALIGLKAGSTTDQSGTGYGYWNQQVFNWQRYNQGVASYVAAGGGVNQLAAVLAPENYDAPATLANVGVVPNVPVTTIPIPNCKFIGVSTPPNSGDSGTYWYGDAVVMKRNAGTGTCKGQGGKPYEYVRWNNSGVPPTGAPAVWTFNKGTGYSGDIVYEFCSCKTSSSCVGPLSCPAAPVGLKVTTTSPLPNAVVGQAYSVSLTASGGFPGAGYTWSLASGTPPSGLQFASSGQLIGTPTATGTFGPLVVYVADSAGNTAAASLTLTVTSH